MESISCSADLALSFVLRLFLVCLIVRALVSWVPSLNGRWTTIVFRVTDPVLVPLDRVIPPIGGLSISFMILFYVVYAGSSFFANQAVECSYGLR